MTDLPKPTVEAKRYDVERLMLGVIRVSRRRRMQRGQARELRILRRWAERQWRKLESEWAAIGDVRITYSEDHADLFIRNEGAYRVDQRAVRRDADWDTTMGSVRLDSTADAIQIAVQRGEWPAPPAEAWTDEEDEACDCDCHAWPVQ